MTPSSTTESSGKYRGVGLVSEPKGGGFGRRRKESFTVVKTRGDVSGF